MGRTVATFRHLLAVEESRWRPFRDGLRRRDREAFDRLFDLARGHAAAATMAASPLAMEPVVLAVLLEHQKALERLTARLAEVDEGAGDGLGP